MSDLESLDSKPKDSPSPNESSQIRRSPWGDRLIWFRESVLDLITRTNPAEVLNMSDDHVPISKEAGKELPADLKRFIDMAKIDAMDDPNSSLYLPLCFPL